ncbi:ribosome maturation factor RimM [Paenibacillus apiarius]|uniref:Ribosome maturation factor RimM n=1 Tax=Paenibacillus apiarius TaxID=46240 RepID=A0ABT4DQE5_9BACL|nr:ribosome maturation factor RimM [Paenibacillus apiarius]MCY9517738.1 ribosome maturation factor RimM [Paenibacillus apiarius]MCY9518338.1 ribosome maturation factor RimM [Paenibacillus apiarius]MCY9551261.1 ribosome maturation factor RimM [Paenibacillus apiarius]MCY9558415.1 ribosome maturation factor RimM [Paenibacillus apiarius]MCY9687066.1 ribosome maturation factor RimM [Paenibacillus apiarius]
MAEKLFNVGKVVNTHGIRGEVKVFPQTDFPDVRFAQGSELLLQHPETQSTLSVTVERSRLHKNMYIVKLKQFDNINDVEKYKGWMLKVSEAQLVELPEDEYYYHEIIGCRVVTDKGEELGVIDEILAPGANDVWVVKPLKGKPILIPVIDDVLLNVDVEGKVVTVHLMEGLI